MSIFKLLISQTYRFERFVAYSCMCVTVIFVLGNFIFMLSIFIINCVSKSLEEEAQEQVDVSRFTLVCVLSRKYWATVKVC